MKDRADRGLYRGLYSAMVDDPQQFQILTSDARLTLFVLRVCRDAGAACIFRYYPDVLAAQTGLSPERVEAALVELARLPNANRPWILRDERAQVVWIRNGLRWDPGISLAHPRQFEGVRKALAALPSTDLAVKFCQYYGITKALEKAMAKALVSLRGRHSPSDARARVRAPRSERARAPRSEIRDPTTEIRDPTSRRKASPGGEGRPGRTPGLSRAQAGGEKTDEPEAFIPPEQVKAKIDATVSRVVEELERKT